jgi:chromosome segregation ATPase
MRQIAMLEGQIKDKDSVWEKTRDQLKSTESRMKAYEKFIRRIQPKYLEAIRDRAKYETEKQAADAAAKNAAEGAEKRAEVNKMTIANLKEQQSDLQGKLDTITAVAMDGEHAKAAEVVETIEQLAAAKAKIESLEKKLKNAANDLEFARDQYQQASNSAALLGHENTELKEEIKDLKILTSDKLLKIQQVNAETEVQEYQRLWETQQAIARERERELDRLRDELRSLRNGRRETRQVSVPRSPRMGVMSPRTGRAPGGSRGTSPAPMMDSLPAGLGLQPSMSVFNQAPGNGRWGHLKD